MPNYAKIKDDVILEFPSYPQQENPNISFGEGWQGGEINEIVYVLVEIENTPQTDYLTQDVEPQLPKKINGKWIQKIKVKDISPEEKVKRKTEKDRRDADENDYFLTKDEIRQIRKLLKAQG